MENDNAIPKWKCRECGFEFSGFSIVCPSCEFADVEEIEDIQPNTQMNSDEQLTK